jgi:hypothetical protein
MTTAMLLGPGARLWNLAGLTATVTEAGRAGVYGVVDGGPAVVRLPLTGWRLAMACEYCDHPGELQLADGQDGDLLCRCCARDHFDQLSAWTRPIPRKVIRRLYRMCERLH